VGLFEKIFGRRQPDRRTEGYFRTLTAYSPVWRTWNGKLYEMDLVRAAIDARARHISKLQVTIQGSAKPKLQTKLRQAPNGFQTWGQFLYRTSTILDAQNTAFLVPILDEYGEPEGIYPILPSSAELVQVQGEPWLRYRFRNGDHAAMELSACGILTKFQYQDDLVGESNAALNSTMELIALQQQGISEAVKNSATFRFMARVNNFSNEKDMAKERNRFNENHLRADASGGILLFPNTYTDIKQIESKPYVVDDKQAGQIQTNVYNYFGVNEDVLQNKAIGDKWSAFYEGAIETFAIQFSDVVSRMLFSARERSAGSRIFATANRLQYMSTADKLQVSTDLVDRGILNRDEAREIWNLPPLPDGQGQAYVIRGEYKNAEEQTGGTENASET